MRQQSVCKAFRQKKKTTTQCNIKKMEEPGSVSNNYPLQKRRTQGDGIKHRL